MIDTLAYAPQATKVGVPRDQAGAMAEAVREAWRDEVPRERDIVALPVQAAVNAALSSSSPSCCSLEARSVEVRRDPPGLRQAGGTMPKTRRCACMLRQVQGWREIPLRMATIAVVLLVPLTAHAQADRLEAAEDAPVFPVEQINTGLPELEQPPHLATPQATLEHFLRAVGNDAHLAAAHALNLRFVAPSEQASRGPELARKLAHLLQSSERIDWGRVPDRPDARVRATGPNQSSTFARRTINLGSLDLGRMPVPINLQRFALPDGTAVWLFSPFTVEHVDALYARHGPGLIERWLDGELELAVAAEVALAEWGLLVLLLALALGLVWALDRLLRAAAGRTSNLRLQYVIDEADRPAACTAAAAVFYVGAEHLLPVPDPLRGFIDPLALFVLLGFGTWFAIRLVGSLMHVLTAKFVTPLSEERHAVRQFKTRVSFAQRGAIVLLAVVAIGLALAQLDVFDTLGLSLLASAGAITVLLSFAARPLLGNLIAGMQIVASKPIRIGDMVDYEDTWARIEDITFTYVVMRTWTDRRLIVPHTYLIERPLSNWSKRSDAITRIIKLFVDHRVDVALLRERYGAIIEGDARWTGENRRLEVVDVRPDGVEIWCWVTGPNSALSWDLQNDVREQLLTFLQTHEGGRFLPRERLIWHQGELDATGTSRSTDETRSPAPHDDPRAA